MELVLANAVVGKVSEMVFQKVPNNVSILCNFDEEFQWLPNGFKEISCVLNEANEESTGQKESVKNWLHRVRDIAWEAEDILQECAVDSIYATNTEFWASSFSQFILRQKMGRRIQKVKARLSSVVQDGKQLNIVRTAVAPKEEESSSGQQVKTTSLLPRDSKPVGIQSKIKSMVSLLENPHIPIIAVVGMGGMGKTYILQHLYDAKKGRYEISAWLSVSQFYSISQLQRDLAFQLDEDLSKKINMGGVSEGPAAESIHGFLLGKRYLIVLDDVWRAAREGDLLTKLGIPTRNNRESKILVSTRSREVCTNLKAHIYEMEYLTDEQSWSLFCAHAFPGCERNTAPEHLKEAAHSIVKKCGNLPLAIKTTAASLTSTTQPSDWQSMSSKLKNVGDSKDLLMDILKLSYHSLPAHLKACFAYLSFFPEDEQIECEYLIYLWMGEGFIPAREDPWGCLNRLANLCLVDVWEDTYLKKYCKIHDLLLDLVILVSGENKCAFGVEEAFSKEQCVNAGGGPWCRLFLAKKDIDDHCMSKRHPVSPTLVRTLSLPRTRGNIPAMLFSCIRVLRVLDLSYTNISTFAASVTEMKLLKVLNLRKNIKKLPKCMRYLKSLFS